MLLDEQLKFFWVLSWFIPAFSDWLNFFVYHISYLVLLLLPHKCPLTITIGNVALKSRQLSLDSVRLLLVDCLWAADDTGTECSTEAKHTLIDLPKYRAHPWSSPDHLSYGCFKYTKYSKDTHRVSLLTNGLFNFLSITSSPFLTKMCRSIASTWLRENRREGLKIWFNV